MKIRTLLSLLTLAALAVAPAAHAKKPESAGKPAAAETAEKTVKAVESAGKSDEKTGEVKGLNKDDYKKLNAAREKAEQDEAVKAAFAAKTETQKAFDAAKKEGDAAKTAEAGKARQAAHEAWVKARRDAITKADPEAGKLDAQVFENMKAMRAAKDRKDAEEGAGKGESQGKAEGKGKGREHAPGQLKKEQGGEGKEHGKGRKKDKSESKSE